MDAKKNVKSYAVWKCNDEATFVRALKKAKGQGKWCDNNPKPAAWTVCVDELAGSEKMSGGIAKNVDTVKRRWQHVSASQISCIVCAFTILQLKQEYLLFKKMHERSGWGWNDTLKVPVIPEEMWESFLAVSPS